MARDDSGGGGGRRNKRRRLILPSDSPPSDDAGGGGGRNQRLLEPLPNDLVEEVLLRLPVRSLLRFLTVCKEWANIISRGYFRRRHVARNVPDRRGVFLVLMMTRDYSCAETELVTCSHRYFSISPSRTARRLALPQQYDGVIVAISNGLALIRHRDAKNRVGKNRHEGGSHQFSDDEINRMETFKSYSVYNPTTEQGRKIEYPRHIQRKRVIQLSLAFDPLVSPHYRILCLERFQVGMQRFKYRFYVYYSENREWDGEPYEVELSDGDFTYRRNGVYWKNRICWPRFYFNFETRMLYPMPHVQRRTSPPLSESNGDLLCVVPFFYIPRIVVYELNLDDLQLLEVNPPMNWSDVDVWKQTKINLRPQIFESDALERGCRLLKYVKCLREEDTYVLFHVAGKLIWYKPSTDMYEVLNFADNGVISLPPTKVRSWFDDEFPPLSSYLHFSGGYSWELAPSLAPV